MHIIVFDLTLASSGKIKKKCTPSSVLRIVFTNIRTLFRMYFRMD